MRKVLYIFGQLDDDDVEWLARTGTAHGWPSGSVVIQQGEGRGQLFIVLEGELEVLDERGAQLARVGVGEVVGEMSFVEARPPSATVRAAHDSLLFEVPHEMLQRQLASDAGFAARFYKAMALFLSDRLRLASSGRGGRHDDELDELDPNVLDNVSQAGARFDRLVARVHRRSFA